MNDIKFAIESYKGFEDLNNNRWDTSNATLLVTYHNSSKNLANRTNQQTWTIDGMESIMGTLFEVGTRASQVIGDFFNNYDEKEKERIEKEVKGGLDSWKKQTVNDAIKEIKRQRELLVLFINEERDSVKAAAKRKDMSLKEFKEWALKKIDFTLMDMSNKSKEEHYYELLKETSEDVFKSIVSRKSWLSDISKAFKDLYGDPKLFSFMNDLGIKESTIKEVENRVNRLLSKYEGIAKNNYKFYDIQRSNVIGDSYKLINDLDNMTKQIINHLISLDKDISKYKASETVVVFGEEYKVSRLRTLTFYIFLFIDTIENKTIKFTNEVIENLAKGNYVICGFPKEVAEVLK